MTVIYTGFVRSTRGPVEKRSGGLVGPPLCVVGTDLRVSVFSVEIGIGGDVGILIQIIAAIIPVIFPAIFRLLVREVGAVVAILLIGAVIRPGSGIIAVLVRRLLLTERVFVLPGELVVLSQLIGFDIRADTSLFFRENSLSYGL